MRDCPQPNSAVDNIEELHEQHEPQRADSEELKEQHGPQRAVSEEPQKSEKFDFSKAVLLLTPSPHRVLRRHRSAPAGAEHGGMKLMLADSDVFEIEDPKVQAEDTDDGAIAAEVLVAYFMQIFLLQIVVQVVCIIWGIRLTERIYHCQHQDGNTPRNGTQVSGPGSAHECILQLKLQEYVLVTIDCWICVLLLVELSSHWLAVPSRRFWGWEAAADVFILGLSFGLIALFVLDEIGAVHIPMESSAIVHVLRDVTRMARLPIFVRDFVGMVRAKRQMRRQAKGVDEDMSVSVRTKNKDSALSPLHEVTPAKTESPQVRLAESRDSSKEKATTDGSSIDAKDHTHLV